MLGSNFYFTQSSLHPEERVLAFSLTCPIQSRVEGQDSNQDLTPKQALISHTSKLDVSDMNTTQNKQTRAEEVGCDCSNLEKTKSSNREALCLMWEWTNEATKHCVGVRGVWRGTQEDSYVLNFI